MKDPYVYDNGTLINKLGIQEYTKLKEAEADIGFVKLISIESVEKTSDKIELIKRIHKHIFEDIFEWAGEFRTVPIHKTEKYIIPGLSLGYCNPEEINEKLKDSMNRLNNIKWSNTNLDDLILQFTKAIVDIWKVHPFRDGNTRSVLSFACMYAAEHRISM